MRWPVVTISAGWLVLFGAHLAAPGTGGPAEADAYGLVLADAEWAVLTLGAAVVTGTLVVDQYRETDWWARLCTSYLLTIALLRMAVFGNDGNYSAVGTWIIVGGLALLARAYRNAYHRERGRRDAGD